MKGNLSRVSLASLVQILGLENRASRISVSRNGEDAEVFLHGGKVVHATCGSLVGDEAFFKLASWPEGAFHVRDLDIPPATTVSLSTDHLLMEAMYRIDEQRRQEPDAAAPQEATAEQEAQDHTLSDYLLEAFVRTERFAELIRSGSRGKKSVFHVLAELSEHFAEVVRTVPTLNSSNQDSREPLSLANALWAARQKVEALQLVEIENERLMLQPALAFRNDRQQPPQIRDQFARDLGRGLIEIVRQFCGFLTSLFHTASGRKEWDDAYDVFVRDLKQNLESAKL